MLFALGFLSLMVGSALVVLGPVPLSKTRTIPAKSSRIAGAVLIAYFPLVLGVRWVWQTLDWERHVAGIIVYSILLGMLAVAAAGFVLRGAFPKKARRRLGAASVGVAGQHDPFAEPESAAVLPGEETWVSNPEPTLIAEAPALFEAIEAPAPAVPAAPRPKKAQAAAPKKARVPPSKPTPKKAAGDNPFDFS